MEELVRSLGQFNETDWVQVFYDLKARTKDLDLDLEPIILQLDPTTGPFLGFALFILSEVILGYAGFYLGGAVSNADWNSTHWEWGDESTAVAATGSGVDAALMPYACYYSANILGLEKTVMLGIGAAYLGSAAENGDWNPVNWNWLSPNTLSGGLVGIQQTLWLVDSLSYIPMFAINIQLDGWMEFVYYAITAATGILLSYNNIAQEYDGNYNFQDWEFTGPMLWFQIIRGMNTGTRLPVGIMEIALDIEQALGEAVHKDVEIKEAIFENYVVPNKWQVGGGLWLAWIYTSVENYSFKPYHWDPTTWGTIEAMLNGIVVGKDLEGAILDVRRHFLGKRSSDNIMVGMKGTKNKILMRS